MSSAFKRQCDYCKALVDVIAPPSWIQFVTTGSPMFITVVDENGDRRASVDQELDFCGFGCLSSWLEMLENNGRIEA
jgi:hypothetical protein